MQLMSSALLYMQCSLYISRNGNSVSIIRSLQKTFNAQNNFFYCRNNCSFLKYLHICIINIRTVLHNNLTLKEYRIVYKELSLKTNINVAKKILHRFLNGKCGKQQKETPNRCSPLLNLHSLYCFVVLVLKMVTCFQHQASTLSSSFFMAVADTSFRDRKVCRQVPGLALDECSGPPGKSTCQHTGKELAL